MKQARSVQIGRPGHRVSDGVRGHLVVGHRADQVGIYQLLKYAIGRLRQAAEYREDLLVTEARSSSQGTQPPERFPLVRQKAAVTPLQPGPQ
jgi:hypothetical protein